MKYLATRNKRGAAALAATEDDAMTRGILLWLLGIPIPIIILLYLFNIV